ncbi:MAG: class I SAM-dependent methyltransferase [Patescibacteria group bacterium]
MSQDYGDVIDPEEYNDGLAEHPDIPQADAGIVSLIREKLRGSEKKEFRVLDLGCGPGRITQSIAGKLLPVARQMGVNLEVVGLDISEKFISYACKNKSGEAILYEVADFLAREFTDKYDVVLMQGVFHHVPLLDRQAWLEKCRDILSEEGVVVIGDEFIPDYSSDKERVLKVAAFYAYIVGYALQSKNKPLAKIESMNMVDDVCAGLPGAGHSNAELISFIQDTSQRIYDCIHREGVEGVQFKSLVSALSKRIQRIAASLAAADPHDHSRGDYKISILRQVEELERVGMKLKEQKVYGPQRSVGGMGVLSFGIVC